MDLTEYLRRDDAPTRAEFCALIGAHAPDLSRWISDPDHKDHRAIPEAKCVLIEQHTKGASTCEENRPDLSWARIPDVNWPHPAGRPVLDLARPADEGSPLSALASA
jgi:DNA-binding transcriptional regulator YdaS (Cro superfamily)